MKKVLLIIFTLISNLAFNQCNGIESFSINPTPINGQYASGTVLNVCYTMNGWNGLNVSSNWVEGFEINLSPSLTPPIPQASPTNCNGGSGNWVWISGTVTSSSTGISAGPGWFFETNQGGVIDGNPGNDWGDFGNCTWNFCFTTTVVETCSSEDIIIQITAGADGTWGSWGNNNCNLSPFNLFNGTNIPLDFESNPITPLVQTVCLGDTTIHELANPTNNSIFYTGNPQINIWNNIGTQQISIIEETINNCIDTTIFTVNVNQLPVVLINPVDTLCFNDSPVQMQAFPIGGTWNIGPNYLPQFGTNWVEYTFIDSFGCRNNDSILVVVNPNPEDVIIIGENSFVNCSEFDRTLQFLTTGNINSSYIWILNQDTLNLTQNTITINLPNISNFENILSVYEINEFGCFGDLTTLEIYSEICGDIYIPNTFSPDYDNINDSFKVTTISKIENFKMQIYNSWGEKIYEFTNQNESWDGLNCQNGVYVYKFSGIIANNLINKIGNINLIR
jgi:gliding motility-associated-like protein